MNKWNRKPDSSEKALINCTELQFYLMVKKLGLL